MNSLLLIHVLKVNKNKITMAEEKKSYHNKSYFTHLSNYLLFFWLNPMLINTVWLIVLYLGQMPITEYPLFVVIIQ